MKPKMIVVWHQLRKALSSRRRNWTNRLNKADTAELETLLRMKIDGLDRRICLIDGLLDKYTRMG